MAADHLWKGYQRELWILVAGDLDLERTKALMSGGSAVSTIPMASDLSIAVLANLRDAFHDYDIVHTHLVHADWHALAASRGRRAAWVSTKHNHDRFRKQRGFGLVERQVDRRADATIAISRSLADFTEKRTGRAPILVPYGWGGPVVPFSPVRESAPFKLLAVGRLVDQKGFSTLVEALPRILERHPGTQLTIAGTGPQRDALADLATGLGVARSITFAGWVPDAAELMLEHDLLVHPARWEGFGLVLLEAMAAGLPVVGSTAGAIPEVLGSAAVALVPADEPDRLADAVDRSLEDAGARTAARRRGLDEVRSRLSLGQSVALLREVYEGLVARRSPLR